MAIKNMIVRGRVGFDAGDVKFIFTHGLAIDEAGADPIVDTDQYARIGSSESTYNRIGISESSYNRTGTSETTYARP